MEKYDIYQDIATRTGGDIYIGVVGPVRTGKSTFITKFMENFVIPNISNKLQKQIATDEMPQSASGKGIMTTQPKFIPANSVKVQFKNKVTANVRLVDCVGYLVDGAIGHTEEDQPRMVKTPWDENEIPFEKAAEIGTKKVIDEYSTIGILVTTDGSFTDIPRQNYVLAEERAVNELKALNKPFIILLNTSNPNSEASENLCAELESKYGVSVICANVLNMSASDISGLMEKILLEFPMNSFNVNLPEWMQTLSSDNRIISELIGKVKEVSQEMSKMKDFTALTNAISDSEYFESASVNELKLGKGIPEYNVKEKDGLYYKVLSEECGEEITNEKELIKYIKDFSASKQKFEKIKDALASAEENGYGVVYPTLEEMNLAEPIVSKQGGKFGVKLKASAPSLHIMKVDVNTEVSPILGTEKQGEDMVKYIMDKYQTDPTGVWETNILGKTLSDLVNDDLNGKLNNMPTEAQTKLRKTLTKIVNEHHGGIICILL